MDAPWTAVYDTPNKSIRQNVARRGAVLHHAAMTSLSGLRDMEVNGTKQVSSTAICKDGNLELIVPDNNYRPWSLSSAYWDSAMRSVETCNESTDGWTISDASHWSLAKAVAYWSSTDGFWPHRDGDPTTWTVIGHREVYTIHGASYSTACPGGMDLGLVVNRAQQLRVGVELMDYTNSAGTGFGQMLQRALTFDVRPKGFGADWKLGTTLWERFTQVVDAVTGASNGVNAKLDALDKKLDAGLNVTVSLDSAQVQEMAAAITDAVVKVQKPIGPEDIGAIASATADESDKRARTRLGS